ncbi:hypothetical protein [Carboxylicivirga sp. RSCT41]|uniref:hypothetical protein n=1 Tax=Carboxylicivirga agarovorans TaxID=3417570 RepID=UPI003D34CD4B
MKKALFIVLLGVMHLHLVAQKDEISVTYSPLSLYRLEKWVEGTGNDQHNYKVLGAFNLNYYRYINSWLKLGVNVMYDYASVEGSGSPYYYTPYSVSSLANLTYKSSKHAFVVAPQIDFEYLNHPKFKLSSGMSLGYANENFTTTGGINTNVDIDGVTVHFNFVSFRWGQKHGLCGSLGAGYKGILNVGYFVRF